MQLIYIHGFNSSSASLKGKMLDDYCQLHHPDITVLRPDMNRSPHEAVTMLSELIAQDKHTGLVGSSLGGYIATVMVGKHNIPAVLINPSTRPFDTLKDYVDAGLDDSKLPPDYVVYTTDTGWEITRQDFDDLRDLYQPIPAHAENLLVLLKTADEVIDYRLAKDYFSQVAKGKEQPAHSQLIIDQGGDHAMLDFDEKIPLVMQFLFGMRC